MTSKEVKLLIATIKSFFPSYAREADAVDGTLMVSLWTQMLARENNNICMAALQNVLRESCYAPTVAEIISEIENLKGHICTQYIKAATAGRTPRGEIKTRAGVLRLGPAEYKDALGDDYNAIQRDIRQLQEAAAPRKDEPAGPGRRHFVEVCEELKYKYTGEKSSPEMIENFLQGNTFNTMMEQLYGADTK